MVWFHAVPRSAPREPITPTSQCHSITVAIVVDVVLSSPPGVALPAPPPLLLLPLPQLRLRVCG
jgi:hypothetical protein